MENNIRHLSLGKNKIFIFLAGIAGLMVILGTISIVVTLNDTTVTTSKAAAVFNASGGCDSSDTFLCNSLALMTEDSFVNKITAGSITSFDGSTHTTKTWNRDASQNYVFKVANEGVESHTIVHTNGKHMVKTRNGNAWLPVDDKPTGEPSSSQASIVEQLGIDEDLAQFFVDNPVKMNYSFQSLGSRNCNGINCIEYLAVDKTAPSGQKQEYLFFDQNTNQLVKFTSIKPEYQAEYTFSYAVPTAIPLPQ